MDHDNPFNDVPGYSEAGTPKENRARLRLLTNHLLEAQDLRDLFVATSIPNFTTEDIMVMGGWKA